MSLIRLGVHAIHTLTGIFTGGGVRKFRASAREVTHGQRRQQDKDDGVQNQATELSGTLTGCDPATEDITGLLVRHRAGDQGIKDGGDNVKLGSVGHLSITKNKIHQA